MSAAGRNILKVIGGSALAAGIGALFARGAETVSQQGPEPVGLAERGPAVPAPATTQDAPVAVEVRKLTLKERWERAKIEGEAAKEAREAELRQYFREKVNDPTAFPPGAPTRSDT